MTPESQLHDEWVPRYLGTQVPKCKNTNRMGAAYLFIFHELPLFPDVLLGQIDRYPGKEKQVETNTLKACDP